MVSFVKLPILKKGEYIHWTMKMEQYLAHIDYALWEVILNGNNVVQMTKDEAAIPDEHLARFYGIKDSKTLWAAIKTRFGGNAESKNMQKNVLKQQFVNFSVSNSKKAPTALMNLMMLIVFLLLQAIVLRHKDLEQINQDDLEEMGLKWHVAMLSLRVKRFYKKTRRKLEFNGKEPVGFDKTKVECYNCHRRGHFARDCRSARNLGNKSRDVGNAGDEENILANDRFKKGEGYHAVPPPLTGNYMPPKPGLSFARLDDSIYKFKISKTVTSLAKYDKDAPETSPASVEKPKEDRNSTERVNTAWSEAVSTVKGNGVTAVRTSVGYVWRSRVNDIDQISKDNRWIYIRVDYGHPQKALKKQRNSYSGCSRHMTGNKAYLIDHQEINNEGFVAFGSSRDELYGMKGIKKEYRNARTPQQNGVAERKNKTLIEAARTMLANSLLPITFWAEAINTACYVLNRALVTKTHNKTPYELLN
nr:ribonuclease H-like domain-containing protein [Tanacetum cinerariifolium]